MKLFQPDEDIKRVERWFSQQGVPRFVDRYSVNESVPLATAVLAIVLAFELTARPEGERPWAWWDEDRSWGLWGLVAPLILLALLMPVLPLLRELLRPAGSTRRRLRWGQIAWMVAIIAFEGFLLSLTTLPPGYASPWVEFAIASCTLVAAMMVLADQPWKASTPVGRVVLTGLVGVLVAATALFTLDRAAEEPRGFQFKGFVEDEIGVSFVSEQFPALLVALLALTSVGLVSRWTKRDETSPRAGGVRSLPALILLFGTATAVLPRLPPDGRLDAVIVVSLLLVVLAAPVISDAAARRSQNWESARADVWPMVRQVLGTDMVLFAVSVLFLVGYPMAVAVDAGAEAWNAVLMNWAYFIAALPVVVFGIDRVIAWGFGEVRRSAANSLIALSQGIPLLLIVVIFFGVTAEVWQLSHRVPFDRFLWLPGFLVVVTALFLVLRSWQELKGHCDFDDWATLKTAALKGGPEAETGIPALVDRVAEDVPEGPLTVDLGTTERLNALVVLLGYQALLLIPVAVLSFFIFLGLGHVAVGEDLLRDWTVIAEDGESFHDPGLFHPLWTKVSLLLAAFSVLSLSVQATQSTEQRDSFFKGAEALRQRLAVRYVYEKANAKRRDPAPAAPVAV